MIASSDLALIKWRMGEEAKESVDLPGNDQEMAKGIALPKLGVSRFQRVDYDSVVSHCDRIFCLEPDSSDLEMEKGQIEARKEKERRRNLFGRVYKVKEQQRNCVFTAV